MALNFTTEKDSGRTVDYYKHKDCMASQTLIALYKAQRKEKKFVKHKRIGV